MPRPTRHPLTTRRRDPLAIHLTVLALALGLLWTAAPGGRAQEAKGAPDPQEERKSGEAKVPPTEADRQPPSGAAGEQPAIVRARGAADALTTDLMGALRSEMEAGGPGRAIRVCSEVAQEIAAEHSTGGMTVRRVSRKPRNPADRPDAYEHARLEQWAERMAAGEPLPTDAIERVDGADGPVLRLMRPITVGPVCLQCHGDPETFSPEVREVLAERYPEDEAVGYEAGDLRGAISVTVPLR